MASPPSNIARYLRHGAVARCWQGLQKLPLGRVLLGSRDPKTQYRPDRVGQHGPFSGGFSCAPNRTAPPLGCHRGRKPGDNMNIEPDNNDIKSAYDRLDYPHVVSLFGRSEKKHDCDTVFMYGEALLAVATTQEDVANALDCLIEASRHGSARASEALGLLYAPGAHVAVSKTPWIQKDQMKSNRFFRKAVEQHSALANVGNAESAYMLGMHYMYGLGVNVDIVDAIAWLERAAANSNPNAAVRLVEVYSNGLFLPPDATKATRWLNRSIELGVPADLFVNVRPSTSSPTS
jgi:hypothetical protein